VKARTIKRMLESSPSRKRGEFFKKESYIWLSLAIKARFATKVETALSELSLVVILTLQKYWIMSMYSQMENPSNLKMICSETSLLQHNVKLLSAET